MQAKHLFRINATAGVLALVVLISMYSSGGGGGPGVAIWSLMPYAVAITSLALYRADWFHLVARLINGLVALLFCIVAVGVLIKGDVLSSLACFGIFVVIPVLNAVFIRPDQPSSPHAQPPNSSLKRTDQSLRD